MRAVLLLSALVGFAGLTALATPAFAQGNAPRTTTPSSVRTSSDRGYGSGAQGQTAAAAQATADVGAVTAQAQAAAPSVQDMLMQAMGQAVGQAMGAATGNAAVTLPDEPTTALSPASAPEHIPGEPIRIRPASGNEMEMLRPHVPGEPIRRASDTAPSNELQGRRSQRG